METFCKVCGGAHITGACTENKKTAENKVNVKEEYGDIEHLFMMENLKENFHQVKDQLDEIKGLIEKYNDHKEKHGEDSDQDQYVDEYRERIDGAFGNFNINGKNVDITELSDEGGLEDIYNDIVINVNLYKETFMSGSNEDNLDTI